MTNIFNFTKANLEALPSPTSGRAEYQDAKTPGLKLRVTQSGAKTFSVVKRVKGGQPLRVTLSRFPEMSIEQARRQAAVILAEIAEGGNPSEVKRALKGEFTFADLFARYLKDHAYVHKRTGKTDEQRYKQYLEKPLGKKKLSAITKDEITKIHSKITADGHPTVANRVLAVLSSVFNRGIQWSVTQTNPCEKIKRNEEVSRDRFIQHDELTRFFDALQIEPNITIRDYIWLSLLTGARRTNVLSMQWSEISLHEGTWRIPMTKNGTPQLVPLSPAALELLKSRRKFIDESVPFVFPSIGVTGHLVEPRKGWERLLVEAGLTNLRIHDLRRTMGSWQAKTGASLSVIGKSLNHKSVQTTAIYARLDIDPIRDSMNTATDAMLKAGGITKAKPRKPSAPKPKTAKPTTAGRVAK
ncbi:MAG: site-specific integrase [Gallionellaceae bacterium]|nr:site-specific integrase [Gallionellaceae bacterium]